MGKQKRGTHSKARYSITEMTSCHVATGRRISIQGNEWVSLVEPRTTDLKVGRGVVVPTDWEHGVRVELGRCLSCSCCCTAGWLRMTVYSQLPARGQVCESSPHREMIRDEPALIGTLCRVYVCPNIVRGYRKYLFLSIKNISWTQIICPHWQPS